MNPDRMHGMMTEHFKKKRKKKGKGGKSGAKGAAFAGKQAPPFGKKAEKY